MDSKIIIETIQAGCSGIHIQGQDVIRIDEEIEKVAAKINFKIQEWNLGYGWVDPKSKRAFSLDKGVSLYEDLKLIADDDPTGKIYIIKNAYSALNNDFRSVARMQHELLRIKKYFSGKSVILLVAKESILFSEIIDLLVTVPCPPLSSRQAEDIFNTVISEKKIVISTAIKSNLISIFSGMERELVERIIQTLINHYGKLFSKDAVNDAIRLKKTHFAQSGLLELVDSTIGIEQIGGLEQLKGWLRNKKQIVDDLTGAQRLGIPAPKGVLLAGMPGCGKSMSAKAAASLFNVPLFRLDIGSLMGKYVGQSEANMKTALQIAEKASPCVLWIDELEKAFSGVNGAGGSTEITTRLFGYFLTWMQEKPGAVFVIATANDITTIPPELLRRGRFDEIFYIDLPNDRERRQIFEVKTKSLKLTLHRGDFERLSTLTDGFSGADIECVIYDALEDLFRNQNTYLTQMVLEKYIEQAIPISIVLKEKIERYQELFKKFSLKPASFTAEEINSIDAKSKSTASAERESAAACEFISPENLVTLIKDHNSSVRLAALKNNQCPFEGLEYIVDRYKPFDFKKTGAWEEAQIAREEFNLALRHPNMSGECIIKLYKRKVINDNELLSLAHKLSIREQGILFDTATVKLPRKIESGTVQNIRCLLNSIVKDGDILIEIDDEVGNTQKITSQTSGVIADVCVKVGDSITSGNAIVKILLPKKEV